MYDAINVWRTYRVGDETPTFDDDFGNVSFEVGRHERRAGCSERLPYAPLVEDKSVLDTPGWHAMACIWANSLLLPPSCGNPLACHGRIFCWSSPCPQIQALAYWLETTKMRSNLTNSYLGGVALADVVAKLQVRAKRGRQVYTRAWHG